MGSSSYDTGERLLRSASLNYSDVKKDYATFTSTFKQQTEKRIHQDMNPKGIKVRECRDSAVHPNATPIQFYLDVTGSMGDIPKELIIKGLPQLMGALTQNGVPDAALMFGAIGDHECDKAPLQVGQFESGDAELDMWLTRTWLEGNGGGNAGESYALAWYFAAFHTVTDAWEKRKQKGFVFTIGDEPDLTTYPMNAIKAIMGDTAVGQDTYTANDLLKLAQEKNHVYHINYIHGYRNGDHGWKQLLGDNYIEIRSDEEIPKVVSNAILKVQGGSTGNIPNPPQPVDGVIPPSEPDVQVIL